MPPPQFGWFTLADCRIGRKLSQPLLDIIAR